MPTKKEDAQALCSETEWKTLVTSFSPKIDGMPGPVAKKQANRVRRFLSKEEAGEADKKRIALFQEALERFEKLLPKKEENNKLATRRKKEKAARERVKALRDQRLDARERLLKKAEEEESEAEGGEDAKADKKAAKKAGAKNQKAGKHSQGKIGSRKV